MKPQKIKCVVWDLDRTLWSGTLLEGDRIEIAPSVRRTIEELDDRGILQSIASRNDARQALDALASHGLRDMFLYPQIGWSAKSSSIGLITERLNIGLDTVAFIDDQQFEREEVQSVHAAVRCYDPQALEVLLLRPEFAHEVITDDSRRRRMRYLADQQRSEAEAAFCGPKEEFLASLGMKMEIRRASKEDLERAHELTVRTNQLNTTGYSYSMTELDDLINSKAHLFLVASLVDRYGSYGTIGLGIVAIDSDLWTIKLLLMSCRVMSRGVGTVLLQHIARVAQSSGARLLVEFIPNEKNRMFFITCRLAGFQESEIAGDVHRLELRGQPPKECPYVDLQALSHYT